MSTIKLFGQPGWGSALTEAQLVWYEIPFEFETVGDLFADEAARQALEKVNPLAQIPTLVLDDGQIMTESAAITLWLADHTGSNELVPEASAPERARFLRWLIFITSNIYPTYTYADVPGRFVKQPNAQQDFVKTVFEYAEKLYSMLNAEVKGPWFLGKRFSALDIYIATMTHWEPGRAWFETNTPELIAIAKAAQDLPRLAPVWEKNFPQKPQ